MRGQPTWYGNTMYRSKTEALAARMLTEAGIAFEYEPRTVHVGPQEMDGYLPDFLVPAWDCIVEVKTKLRADDGKIGWLSKRFPRCLILTPDLARHVRGDGGLAAPLLDLRGVLFIVTGPGQAYDAIPGRCPCGQQRFAADWLRDPCPACGYQPTRDEDWGLFLTRSYTYPVRDDLRNDGHHADDVRDRDEAAAAAAGSGPRWSELYDAEEGRYQPQGTGRVVQAMPWSHLPDDMRDIAFRAPGRRGLRLHAAREVAEIRMHHAFDCVVDTMYGYCSCPHDYADSSTVTSLLDGMPGPPVWRVGERALAP